MSDSDDTPPTVPSAAAQRDALHWLARLIDIMAALRTPGSGCPWDLEQDFRSIAPYTVEEAYEVAEAIRLGDMDELCGELGDLLLQVVFHARMAEEAGAFALADVARRIAGKMVDRHPHVFGDADVRDAAAQTRNWESLKAAERQAKAVAGNGRASALDGVALALPALMRAEKLQKRAARVGFDWPSPAPVLDKVQEEIAELREAAAQDGNRAAVAEEAGDLLFAVVNLVRHLGVDAETALRDANAKFERRFRGVEQALAAAGRRAEQAGLDELERHWQAEKARERG